MGIPGQLAYRAYQLFWRSFDWLYPPRCGGCGKAGKRWCDRCMEDVQLIVPPFCPICGSPQKTDDLCRKCVVSQPSFTALRSWAAYSGSLRYAIQRLKYHRDVSMGEVLSRPMVDFIKLLHWPIDTVLPVPVSLARLAERGYNQVSLLARPLALGLELPYNAHALVKERETRSQVGLSAKERRENVKGVFRSNRRIVNGKSMLVVDDITTTGATLEACAQALLQSGAKQVFGITLARSVFLDV